MDARLYQEGGGRIDFQATDPPPPTMTHEGIRYILVNVVEATKGPILAIYHPDPTKRPERVDAAVGPLHRMVKRIQRIFRAGSE